MLFTIIITSLCVLLRIFYAFALKIYEIFFRYFTDLTKVILIFIDWFSKIERLFFDFNPCLTNYE